MTSDFFVSAHYYQLGVEFHVLYEELILPLNMKSENEVYPMKMKLGDRKGNTTEI
jgi:hypothetical protein